MFHPFVLYLMSDPRYFFAVALTVIASITLHELAHGWAAIRHGDQTPIHSGHMSGNPLVHMGPYSIFCLLLVGLAWGAMPIDPTRLRGKYAEAFVAAAGPATNLILGLLAMLIAGLWIRFAPIEAEPSQLVMNGRFLLFIFSITNLVLCVFNLFPIPPLDGSHILANFSHPYRRFISDPSKQGVFLLFFIVPFALSGMMFDYAFAFFFRATSFIAGQYVSSLEIGFTIPG